MNRKTGNLPFSWDGKVSLCLKENHIDEALGAYKAGEFLSLIKKWAGGLDGKRILKTDLREEAFGQDQILFSLPSENVEVCAIDISYNITKSASERKDLLGFGQKYICSDVRRLPFRDGAFDIILSTSTLDHFVSDADLLEALKELTRVMKKEGLFIATFNNQMNINYWFILTLGRLMRLISYPTRFYTERRLKEICSSAGLVILDREAVVHIISPVNTVLLILRRFLKKDAVAAIANKFTLLARYFGRRRTKFLTAWFLALKLQREE